MSDIRPGMNLGTMLQGLQRADASGSNIYAEIISIGAGSVDFVLESGAGLMQKKRYTGTPRVGDRVRVQVVAGEWTAICAVRS
ncbi:MAG: hypothetical protein ACOYM3_01100 [Terrimicrobiaceae bacterium]